MHMSGIPWKEHMASCRGLVSCDFCLVGGLADLCGAGDACCTSCGTPDERQAATRGSTLQRPPPPTLPPMGS